LITNLKLKPNNQNAKNFLCCSHDDGYN